MADQVRNLAGHLNGNRAASTEIRIGTVVGFSGSKALIDLAGVLTKATVLDNVTIAEGNLVSVAVNRRDMIVTGTVGLTDRSGPAITPPVVDLDVLPPDYDPADAGWRVLDLFSNTFPVLRRKYSSGTWTTVTSDPVTFVSPGDALLFIYDNASFASTLSQVYEWTSATFTIGGTVRDTYDIRLHAYNSTNYPTSGAPTFISGSVYSGSGTGVLSFSDAARVGAHFRDGIGGIAITNANSNSFNVIGSPTTLGEITLQGKIVDF